MGGGRGARGSGLRRLRIGSERGVSLLLLPRSTATAPPLLAAAVRRVRFLWLLFLAVLVHQFHVLAID